MREDQRIRQEANRIKNEAFAAMIETAIREAFPDAPIDRVAVTKAGKAPRFALVLADTRPGWRAKDHNPVRRAIKMYVKERFGFRIPISAQYSCLDVVGGGVVRRDNTGRIIAVYSA